MAKAASTRSLQAARLVQDLIRAQRAEKNLILEDLQERMRSYEKPRQETFRRVHTALSQNDAATDGQEKALLATFKTDFQTFEDTSDRVAELALSQETAEAKRLSANDGRKAFDQAEAMAV